MSITAPYWLIWLLMVVIGTLAYFAGALTYRWSKKTYLRWRSNR